MAGVTSAMPDTTDALDLVRLDLVRLDLPDRLDRVRLAFVRLDPDLFDLDPDLFDLDPDLGPLNLRNPRLTRSRRAMNSAMAIKTTATAASSMISAFRSGPDLSAGTMATCAGPGALAACFDAKETASALVRSPEAVITCTSKAMPPWAKVTTNAVDGEPDADTWAVYPDAPGRTETGNVASATPR